jgi:hypothetical protein
MEENKIAIYTCITGGYDTPTDNFMIKPGYDYILLSDQYIKTNCWKCFIPVFKNAEHLDNTKKQRFIKTHPHELFLDKYDVVIWIDANTTIDERLYAYIESNLDYTITFKNHPFRHCLYDEIHEVKISGKDKPEICDKLYDRYKSEGVPEKNGLYETNIIISHPNNPTVQTIFNEWWKEIEQNSKRDQLSLNYILWKYNLIEFPHTAISYNFTPKPHKLIRR